MPMNRFKFQLLASALLFGLFAISVVGPLTSLGIAAAAYGLLQDAWSAWLARRRPPPWNSSLRGGSNICKSGSRAGWTTLHH